jgi:hypothetical protein
MLESLLKEENGRLDRWIMQRHGGHYSIMHRFRFVNVYEFQCFNSSTHLQFVTRPSPLGTLTPETSASRATLHLPLATFS